MVTLQYVLSTELQPATWIAVSNPARTGAAGRAQENQSKLWYRRSWAFDIEGLEPLISKLTLRYRYMIWPSISKILRYRILLISKKKLRYRRIFDIGVLQYRSTDLRYRSFFISVCFYIEACRLRYQSTDLLYRSYMLYPISKLKHWPSISKVWYSISSIYRYRVFCFDIEAWQGSRCILDTNMTL